MSNVVHLVILAALAISGWATIERLYQDLHDKVQAGYAYTTEYYW